MQQRLRQAEHLAAVGRLSAQVAHEVRNPLHAIGLETELALEEAKEEGMLRESLFSIQASVERLEMLTENYLKFSKLSSGDKKEFNILETIQKLLRQHKPQIEEMNIDVSIHSNVKPIAFGDEPAVHQVLENLISNAIQALSEVSDRKLIWTIESDQKTVTVRLEDNALGIDPETLSNLFEPFVTTKAQGTGLGLSFVKRVIDDHNGIVVGGNRAGRGAYFEFRLPLEEEVKGHQRKGSIDEQSTFS